MLIQGYRYKTKGALCGRRLLSQKILVTKKIRAYASGIRSDIRFYLFYKIALRLSAHELVNHLSAFNEQDGRN
jgi:hypothetical protein